MGCVPFVILGFLSVILVLWRWQMAVWFPLGRRNSTSPTDDPITVLKPLKGCDAETEACLLSWVTQDYPGPVQFLCGISSRDDPACDVVRSLIGRYPHLDLSMIVAHEPLGPNEKVSKLIQMTRQARYPLLIVSDADVRVPPDLLQQLVHELKESRNTLVCCLYRLANPSTLAMQWEAVAINSDFWSEVLQAQTLAPLDFALGATIALRRESLDSMGGFEVLVDLLADDFQLGQQFVRKGGEVRLASIVVECWEPPRTWNAVWRHQLRWARTIRACRPWPYFFSILGNGTFWPLLWMAASGPWTGRWSGWEWIAAGACLVFRAGTAWDQQRRLAGGAAAPGPWWMPWFKDLAQVFLWAAAYLGNTVYWRGTRYRVIRGGRLSPIVKGPRAGGGRAR